MSLIEVESFMDTETKFVSCGGELGQPFITQYVQYFKGNPVARFRVSEIPRVKHKFLSIKHWDYRHGL